MRRYPGRHGRDNPVRASSAATRTEIVSTVRDEVQQVAIQAKNVRCIEHRLEVLESCSRHSRRVVHVVRKARLRCRNPLCAVEVVFEKEMLVGEWLELSAAESHRRFDKCVPHDQYAIPRAVIVVLGRRPISGRYHRRVVSRRRTPHDDAELFELSAHRFELVSGSRDHIRMMRTRWYRLDRPEIHVLECKEAEVRARHVCIVDSTDNDFLERIPLVCTPYCGCCGRFGHSAPRGRSC